MIHAWLYYSRKMLGMDAPIPAAEWDEAVFAKHIVQRQKDEGLTKAPLTVAFSDNLHCQTTEDFCKMLFAHGTMLHLIISKETEALQPIDAGLGVLFKHLVAKEQERWLEEDDTNYETWEGTIKATMKRVLITNWVGAAWTALCNNYASAIKKCFIVTGSLITIDGSDDELIRPIKGVEYVVPPINASIEVPVNQNPDVVDLLPVVEQGPESYEVANVIFEDVYDNLEEHTATGREIYDDIDDVSNDIYCFDELMNELDPPVVRDAASAPASDASSKKTTADNEESDENESWNQCFTLAQICLDLKYCPISTHADLPKRIAGKYIFYFSDGQWDLQKIVSLNLDGTYRLKSIVNEKYFRGKVTLNPNDHGREKKCFVILVVDNKCSEDFV